jgi:hypothetical protein
VGCIGKSMARTVQKCSDPAPTAGGGWQTRHGFWTSAKAACRLPGLCDSLNPRAVGLQETSAFELHTLTAKFRLFAARQPITVFQDDHQKAMHETE